MVSVERHPLTAQALREAAPPELAPLAQQLAAQWPLLLPGLHRLVFEGGAVELTLALGDAAVLVPQLVLGADAIYLDGFSPARNPDMWSAPLLKAVARLARPVATLATWSTARPVRDALAAGGFALELRPGFASKREMLTGRFAPRYTVRRHEPPAAYAGPRHAVVIGAGLAGCSTALALARRGWEVDLLERGSGVAAGASGLPAGMLHPQIAADDSRLARLTRAGFVASLQQLQQLDGAAALARVEGIFQQAVSAQEAAAWQAALDALGLPPAYAQVIDAPAAAAHVGLTPRRPGLWFPQGAVVASGRWCAAMLQAAGPAVRLHSDTTVTRVVRDEGWRVERAQGAPFNAPVVVHASALAGPQLASLTHAPVRAVRGRLSLLAADDLAGLKAAIAGDGYAMRAPGTAATPIIGASYELPLPGGGDAAGPDDDLVHAGNVARLARLLAAPPTVRRVGIFDEVRAVAPDRLPLAGALADEAATQSARASLRGAHLADLPRQPGAYALFALGSRGLVLAPLLAQLVMAQLEGEPWPIERDLAASVDPARFLLQRLRC
jgi:tRNA 5-methylaminomethyl-2-thiouridine biosynthesis bifunctional protein